MLRASRLLCKKGQLDVIYYDLIKAIDVVGQKVLLTKLFDYYVYCTLDQWQGSYQHGRSCSVRVDEAHLLTYWVTSRVNDVEAVIKHSSLMLHVDIIKLLRESRSVSDCAKLQEDVHSIWHVARATVFWLIDQTLSSWHISEKLISRTFNTEWIRILFSTSSRYGFLVYSSTASNVSVYM